MNYKIEIKALPIQPEGEAEKILNDPSSVDYDVKVIKMNTTDSMFYEEAGKAIDEIKKQFQVLGVNCETNVEVKHVCGEELLRSALGQKQKEDEVLDDMFDEIFQKNMELQQCSEPDIFETAKVVMTSLIASGSNLSNNDIAEESFNQAESMHTELAKRVAAENGLPIDIITKDTAGKLKALINLCIQEGSKEDKKATFDLLDSITMQD